MTQRRARLLYAPNPSSLFFCYMRLLDRYLLRELLLPLGYCLSGFLILLVVSDLIADLGNLLQNYKLGGWDIVQYYAVKIPEFLVLVLPIALLLALLYALTNHTRNHELTAMRAAGVSLWRICLPYLAVGFLGSLAVLALNELWVPDSDDKAEHIKNRYKPAAQGAVGAHQVKNLGFTNARNGRLWRIGIYDTQSGDMLAPQVLWTQSDGTHHWIFADRAAYTNGAWTFCKVREYKEENKDLPPALVRTTNELTFAEFSETPELIRSEIKISSSLTLRKARKADVPVSEIINYLRLHPQPSRTDGAWLYTKLHGRLATPWTCLVVVLIAVPFGAASGRRNVFIGVAGSIIICFAYFVLQQVSLALGTGDYLAPWLAGWLPNLVFGLTGLWLTARVR